MVPTLEQLQEDTPGAGGVHRGFHLCTAKDRAQLSRSVLRNSLPQIEDALRPGIKCLPKVVVGEILDLADPVRANTPAVRSDRPFLPHSTAGGTASARLRGCAAIARAA